MRFNLRTIIILALSAMTAIGAAVTTVAHEHREVADGQYELTVGFLNEPAYVNLQNGLSLRVETTGDEPAPVEGLVETLDATVIYGDQEMELELSPVFNDPGHYQSIFFPTALGAYTFQITGEIEGNAIDESFTSGPETFAEVEPIEPLQFPKPAS